MKKHHFQLLLLALATLSACSHPDKSESNLTSANKEFSIYSDAVKDSFYVSVQLPEAYYKNTAKKYPTVYLLDANFHFPVLAATVRQYEKGGLLPPMILVGIGYKSFKLMDSLRVRDYLYPAALPSDEMSAVGGGGRFNVFITKQLVPYIDSVYQTETTSRSLVGHSFGGYFSLYALLNQLENNQDIFKNFASASPSLWYNNFYLNQLTEKLKSRNNRDTLKIFMTVGGLEDSKWAIMPVKKLANDIESISMKDVKLRCKIYSNLGHMDVAAITFTKALENFYKQDN